jgi:hypothetical protein
MKRIPPSEARCEGGGYGSFAAGGETEPATEPSEARCEGGGYGSFAAGGGAEPL